MFPLLLLGAYLLIRIIFKPTDELFLSLKFNGFACAFMLTQYFVPTLYNSFLWFMGAYAFWLLLAGRQSPDGAYLQLALSHAIFHDEFMLHENILFNVTVDDMLHGIMFLLVAGLYKNRRVAFGLRAIGALNMLVAFLSLDLKYTNYCNELVFGLPPNQVQPLTEGCAYWFGGYGGVATVIMAVGALSGMLVLHDQSLTVETLFWEMCPYFLTTTAYYFVEDPVWVADLYERIKYDQFYFMLPCLYHLGAPLMSKIKVLPMAPLS